MKPENKIIRKGNIENWWHKSIHCKKCKHWIKNFSEDDLDSYGGCNIQYLRDYEIKKCTLTRDQYLIINC